MPGEHVRHRPQQVQIVLEERELAPGHCLRQRERDPVLAVERALIDPARSPQQTVVDRALARPSLVVRHREHVVEAMVSDLRREQRLSGEEVAPVAVDQLPYRGHIATIPPKPGTLVTTVSGARGLDAEAAQPFLAPLRDPARARARAKDRVHCCGRTHP